MAVTKKDVETPEEEMVPDPPIRNPYTGELIEQPVPEPAPKTQPAKR